MAHDQRVERFNVLMRQVEACQKCPRLQGRPAVLSEKNGSLHSNVIFIAEAPGRWGADRTLIPLHGDQTGRNFEALLRAAHLKRCDIFITNAVLRNPRNVQGNNDPPTSEEVSNCSEYLAETLDIIRPKVVVTLGRKALDAIGWIAPHDARWPCDIGKHIPWQGRILIPLYHPSPQAQFHRSFERQQADFRKLGAFMRAMKRRTRYIARARLQRREASKHLNSDPNIDPS